MKLIFSMKEKLICDCIKLIKGKSYINENYSREMFTRSFCKNKIINHSCLASS